MTILQSIYNAFVDCNPHKRKLTKEHLELVEEYSKTLDQLQNSLSEEQEPLFFEAEAQRNLIAADEEEAMFHFGFRIGAKLMFEIFATNQLL